MYGRNSYLGQGLCTHGVKEEKCKVCAWIIENCNACSRCQARVVTVEVETGFSGEFEFLCGPCVSKERADLEESIVEYDSDRSDREKQDEIGDRDVGFMPVPVAPPREEPCGTAQIASILTNADTHPIAKIAPPSEEVLLPDDEWKNLSPDSQHKLQTWFRLATERLQLILDEPEPPREEVRMLVAKWRQNSKGPSASNFVKGMDHQSGICADELEAALAATPTRVQPDAKEKPNAL